MLQLIRYISRLAGLDDYRSAPAATDGQVLTYRTADSKWGPEDAGGGGGVTVLAPIVFDAGLDATIDLVDAEPGVYVQIVDGDVTGEGVAAIEITLPATSGVELRVIVRVRNDAENACPFSIRLTAGSTSFEPDDAPYYEDSERYWGDADQAYSTGYFLVMQSAEVYGAVRWMVTTRDGLSVLSD